VEGESQDLVVLGAVLLDQFGGAFEGTGGGLGAAPASCDGGRPIPRFA
jgi:hypothetical protein